MLPLAFVLTIAEISAQLLGSAHLLKCIQNSKLEVKARYTDESKTFMGTFHSLRL